MDGLTQVLAYDNIAVTVLIAVVVMVWRQFDKLLERMFSQLETLVQIREIISENTRVGIVEQNGRLERIEKVMERLRNAGGV